MDWLDLLYDVLKLCVIPMLGVLTAYLVSWLEAKKVETQNKVDNDIADKYIGMLFETICNQLTNHVFVRNYIRMDNLF